MRGTWVVGEVEGAAVDVPNGDVHHRPRRHRHGRFLERVVAMGRYGCDVWKTGTRATSVRRREDVFARGKQLQQHKDAIRTKEAVLYKGV